MVFRDVVASGESGTDRVRVLWSVTVGIDPPFCL
jgi:hypothetical protein